MKKRLYRVRRCQRCQRVNKRFLSPRGGSSQVRLVWSDGAETIQWKGVTEDVLRESVVQECARQEIAETGKRERRNEIMTWSSDLDRVHSAFCKMMSNVVDEEASKKRQFCCQKEFTSTRAIFPNPTTFTPKAKLFSLFQYPNTFRP